MNSSQKGYNASLVFHELFPDKLIHQEAQPRRNRGRNRKRGGYAEPLVLGYYAQVKNAIAFMTRVVITHNLSFQIRTS